MRKWLMHLVLPAQPHGDQVKLYYMESIWKLYHMRIICRCTPRSKCAGQEDIRAMAKHGIFDSQNSAALHACTCTTHVVVIAMWPEWLACKPARGPRKQYTTHLGSSTPWPAPSAP